MLYCTFAITKAKFVLIANIYYIKYNQLFTRTSAHYDEPKINSHSRLKLVKLRTRHSTLLKKGTYHSQIKKKMGFIIAKLKKR